MTALSSCFPLPAFRRPVVVVGAGFVDVVARVPHLPKRGQDLFTDDHHVTVGGCGLNVVRRLVRLGVSVIPGVPVGEGRGADRVRAVLAELGIESPLHVPGKDNGWCVALVEPDKERSFVTFRGVETQVSKDLLQNLDVPSGALLYVSGYELLAPQGGSVLDWIAAQDLHAVLVDPGPRIETDPRPDVLARLDALGAILTVNAQEARTLVEDLTLDALAHWVDRRGAPAIVRVGADGAFVGSPQETPQLIPAPRVSVVDTVGAGDAHAAGVLAGLAADMPLVRAVALGNQVAADSVTRAGA